MPKSRWVVALVGGTCALMMAHVVAAKVLLAKDEALAKAFPEADRVEERAVFLTATQKASIERQAGAALESQLWTIFVGWRGTEILGYAIIDNHVVRTLPEAFIVLLAPDGTVRRVEILAFYEPAEYMPSDQWIAQFTGRELDDDLAMRHGIQGLTGATLSAVALTAGVRRVLAVFHTVVLDAEAVRTPEANKPAGARVPLEATEGGD